MVLSFAKRMLTEPDPRLLGKFAWNFGIKGALSVEKYKRRLNAENIFHHFCLFQSSPAVSYDARAVGWMSLDRRNRFPSPT